MQEAYKWNTKQTLFNAPDACMAGQDWTGIPVSRRCSTSCFDIKRDGRAHDMVGCRSARRERGRPCTRFEELLVRALGEEWLAQPPANLDHLKLLRAARMEAEPDDP